MKVKVKLIHTSHPTVQDHVVLIWEKEIQVLSLEMLHVTSSPTEQQQGRRWQPAHHTRHPSLSFVVRRQQCFSY